MQKADLLLFLSAAASAAAAYGALTGAHMEENGSGPRRPWTRTSLTEHVKILREERVEMECPSTHRQRQKRELRAHAPLYNNERGVRMAERMCVVAPFGKDSSKPPPF